MDVYLDNAATSHPKPEPVRVAVMRALTALNANPGRSGHRRALAAARAVMDCRETLAALLGAPDPMRIAFAYSATDALNLALRGMLRQGDHVVTSVLEHNSVLRPLMGMADRGFIDVTLIAPDLSGMIDPAAVIRALRPNSRLVAVTHASNVLGDIQPVAAIGARLFEAGIPMLIDGAQALGETPVYVEAMHCALYAFPGHKGLLGPQGTGALYIHTDWMLAPFREGGTGSSSESMRQPAEEPDRYESGTLNLPGIAGMDAGARYVMENTLSLRAHRRALMEQLLSELRAMDGVTVYGTSEARDRVGVVSFNVGDFASGQVADALDRLGFQVRGGLHCAPGAHEWLGTQARGAVRASVGHETSRDEIEAFVRAVDGIARGGLS